MRLVDRANQQRGTGLFSVMTVWVSEIWRKWREAKDSKCSLRRQRKSVCAARYFWQRGTARMEIRVLRTLVVVDWSLMRGW